MANPTLAEVVLSDFSGLPTDVYVNTWAFQPTSALGAGGEAAILSALAAFYDNLFSGTHLGEYFSGVLHHSGAGAPLVKMYDLTGHLSGTPHGSPVATGSFDISAAGGSLNMPNECAVACSFHADYGTDPEHSGGTRPRARDRGRVFLGPFCDLAMVGSTVASHSERPRGDLLDNIAAAAGTLLADASVNWSVWSRRNASIEVVTAGWVDNAWDTQRRRGQAPTSRVTF